MTVFVAGGSRGIGQAIAVGLASPGEDVVIVYRRDDEAADETSAAVRERGAIPHLIRGDIGTPDGAAEVLAEASRMVDRIDLLVHSVVDPVAGPLLGSDPHALSRSVEVGGLSLLYLARAASPLLKRGSSIVYLSSRGSRVVIPGYGVLGITKALAEAAIRYLAVELGGSGVRANVVMAGALDTRAFRAMFQSSEEYLERAASRTTTGEALEMEDVVAAVRFLASPEARMVQGHVLVVDGGAGLR